MNGKAIIVLVLVALASVDAATYRRRQYHYRTKQSETYKGQQPLLARAPMVQYPSKGGYQSSYQTSYQAPQLESGTKGGYIHQAPQIIQSQPIVQDQYQAKGGYQAQRFDAPLKTMFGQPMYHQSAQVESTKGAAQVTQLSQSIKGGQVENRPIQSAQIDVARPTFQIESSKGIGAPQVVSQSESAKGTAGVAQTVGQSETLKGGASQASAQIETGKGGLTQSSSQLEVGKGSVGQTATQTEVGKAVVSQASAQVETGKSASAQAPAPTEEKRV